MITPTRDEAPRRNAEPPHLGTVARVVRLLEAAADSGEIGIRPLARQTGIDKSAVSRLLAQLAELGMLEGAAGGGRYRLGQRFFAISAAVTGRDRLTVAARGVLERLVGRFNETSYVAVLEGDAVVFREKVECDQAVRYVVALGTPGALHAGAAGRAILSGLPDDEVERRLSAGPLPAITSQTITDPSRLRDLVAEDRARGYTLSIGERNVGGAGVAVPFSDAGGRVAGSIVMTMPASRFEKDRLAEFGAAVREAADELSARLGYRP